LVNISSNCPQSTVWLCGIILYSPARIQNETENATTRYDIAAPSQWLRVKGTMRYTLLLRLI